MTSRTLDQVLATAWSGVGQWWPNDWWPNGRSSYNDCAAFVSWALYGLNGREPFYTYVPHIMDRAIRESRWHGGRGLVARPQNSDGAKGMQAGDVVILDWRFRGSRDHVGIALAAPNGGTVRVIQANNGGGGLGNANTRDPAEVVSYSTKYVLGYYRPAYATSTPAGGTGTPIEEDDMQQDERDALMRIKQIAEALDKNINDGGSTLRRAADRILGVLRSRFRDGTKQVLYVLDEGDGAELQRNIAASTARTVGETSSAFHQLVAAIAAGKVDPATLAAALAPLLEQEARSLSDADLAAASTAIADELDRRARERLGS